MCVCVCVCVCVIYMSTKINERQEYLKEIRLFSNSFSFYIYVYISKCSVCT